MADPPDDSEPKVSRRKLSLGVLVGSCAIGAATAIPAAAFVAAPITSEKSGASRWVRTLKLEQLKENEPKRVAIIADRRDAWTIEKSVELGSVWLVRKGTDVLAFSAVCPHLGCSVNVADTGFACPCHTSSFDANGHRASGPAPRDLDTLVTRIEDGFVAVDFRRFRIGVAEKVQT